MDNNRERDRDRSKRGDKPSRFSDAGRDRSSDRGGSESRRLIVSNIPYEYRWTELKDLFKAQVGDVAYVELFNDNNGKPMGTGVVEFTTTDAMKKALQVMHRYDLNGRKMVLKETTGNERTRFGMGRSGGGGGGPNRSRPEKDWGPKPTREPENYNTYGLNLQFLESINIQPPLGKKVFVANLDYKADRAKIKEVFKLAGKVRNIDLAVDKDGNSKGYAVIEYDHPVEAVQAISMFDKQMLFDRKMTVRMDKGQERLEPRLPEGLKGIGVGLGPNGEPLRDVARNIVQNQGISSMATPSATASLSNNSVLGAIPNAGVTLNGLGAGLANPLAANTALGGGLGLQALGLTGLGALQNQLLQQSSLTATDLATVLQAQAQASMNNANIGLGSSDLNTVSGLNSNMMGQSSNMISSGNSMGSGQMSGAGRQMSSMSSNQHFGRDNRDNNGTQSNKKISDMVVISNLPSTVTWQLIREKFSECGEVKFAEMTGIDTAIVRFFNEWDAERAIKMFDRTRIDGRTIDVNYF